VRRDVGLGDPEVPQVLGGQVHPAALPVGRHVLDQPGHRHRRRQIVGVGVELGRAVAGDVEQEPADRLGGLAGVAAQLVERGVAAALEIGPETGQELGELGDRQRELVDGVGQRHEHRVLGVAAVRRVQLLLPAIELAGAPALVGLLIGEVIGDAGEREQREDVPAQLAAREHRRDRIVVVAGADQRLAVAVARALLERGRQRHGERGGAGEAQALDHGESFTM
jgi:hypothetical protein